MQVPTDAFDKPKVARQAMGELVNMDLMQSWQDIRDAIFKAKDTLTSLDRSMKIDMAILGDGAEKTLLAGMRRQMLASMPSATVSVTLESAFTAVRDLKNTKQCKCSPIAAQTEVGVVSDILANMMSGISPDPAQVCSQDVFFKEVFTKLCFFLRVAKPGGQKHHSGAAAAAFFSELSEHASLYTLTLAELEVIQNIRWRLDS